MSAYETISTTQVDDVTVIRCKKKRIRYAEDSRLWGQEISAVLEQEDTKRILLCLNGVEFLSNYALTQLLGLYEEIAPKYSVPFVLCSVSPEVFEVFVITKINQRLRIAENEEKALAYFLSAKE